MGVKIKKVGKILPDGSISIIDEMIVIQPDISPSQSQNIDYVLAKIDRAKKISRIDLSRSLSYKLNAQKLEASIEALIQAGLVSKTIDGGRRIYHRTPKPAPKFSDGITKNIKTNLTNSEIEEQIGRPIALPTLNTPNIWAYKNFLLQVSYDEYLTDEEISLRIKLHVLDHEKEIEEIRSQIRFLEQILKKGELGKREHIPEHIKMYVWRRDKGRCVECDSKENLEFDHIIPVSRGGSNTERNIQILCGKCNRVKSDKIG